MVDFLMFALGGGIIVGVTSALLGKYLDSIMDYGSILGGVRYWLAIRYAINNGYDGIARLLDETKYMEDYHERLERMNNLYWMLAGTLQRGKAFSWFTGWICIVCLTSRIVGILWLLSIPMLLKFGASAVGIFVMLLIATVVANLTVQKI